MFLAIIAIVLTLILVIGIHEGGHALVARIFQVRIKKISIGFGKPLFRWQSNRGCEWVWATFPLGGYVQLQNTRISPVDASEQEHCFDKKPVWVRIFILLAGAGANLIAAWFALVILYSIGLPYKIPQIQSVQPDSLAAHAGIQADDQVVAIAGKTVTTWNDVGMQLIASWGKKDIPMTLSRNNGTDLKEIKLDLSKVTFHGFKLSLLTSLGLQPNLTAPQNTLRFQSLGDAVHQANQVIVATVYFFLMILKQLLSGVIPFSVLLGPLGIFAASLESLTQGIAVFLFFIATLSMAVAVVNLFPVPGLDGGSIVYALIEKIRGKPVSVAMEVLLHRLVFIVFCLVLVHLLMNDLQRL